MLAALCFAVAAVLFALRVFVNQGQLTNAGLFFVALGLFVGVF